MPSYDSRCRDCGKLSMYVSTVANCHTVPPCSYCGGAASKVIITAPRGYVKGNFDAFKSPVDGSIITGHRALEEHNKRNQVANLHDGYEEAKVVAGDFGRVEAKPDKKDIAADIAESIHKVKEGYKPLIAGEADGHEHWN